MHRTYTVIVAVSVVVIGGSAVARAQAAPHRVYLPYVRRDPTPSPTPRPTAPPAPTQGVVCGTIFKTGFEPGEPPWEVVRADSAGIDATRGFAGRRSMRLVARNNSSAEAASAPFAFSSIGEVLSYSWTMALRGVSTDKGSDEDVFEAMLFGPDDGIGLPDALVTRTNTDARDGWTVVTGSRVLGNLVIDWPTARIDLFACNDASDRTTWWVDEVRVDACWWPRP